MIYGKKIQEIFLSKHFRSLFILIFTIMTIIFIIACSFFYNEKLSGFQKEAETQGTRVALMYQETLNTVKNNCVFIGSMDSVIKLLNLEHLTNYDIYKVANDIAPLYNQSKYEDFTLFISKFQKIYVSGMGMYTYDDYYDKEFLQKLNNAVKDEWWETDKSYKRYYGEKYPISTIKYIRKIPIYEQNRYGYVTVNIPVSYLQQLMHEQTINSSFNISFYFQDMLVATTEKEYYNAFDGALSVIENEEKYWSGKNKAVLPSSIKFSDTQLRFSVKGEVIKEYLVDILPYLIVLYLLLILVIIMFSGIYSYRMLKNVDVALKKAGIISDISSMTAKKDEFGRLNEAFEGLNTRIEAFQGTIEKNKPLIQERLISELICNYVDIESRRNDYAKYDITFPYPYFAVVVVELTRMNIVYSYSVKEQLKLLLMHTSMEAFSVLSEAKVYSAYTEGESVSFLINMSRYEGVQDDIRKICWEIENELQETINLKMTFSVAICLRENPIPYRAWSQAKKNMLFSSSDLVDDTVFSYQSDYTPTVDEKVVNAITQAILNRDIDALNTQTKNIHVTVFELCLELEETSKLICGHLLAITAKLLGLDINISTSQICNAVKKVSEAVDIPQCESIFYSYFSGMITSTKAIHEDSYVYVKKSIEYITKNYKRDISIPQIADEVEINPVYLNKLFKISTGKTISEYLNSYRIEASKNMLLNSKETIASISQKIGYNDTRSYIRFFKKYIGQTPNEFRKDKLEEK